MNTNVVAAADLNYGNLDEDSRAALKTDVTNELLTRLKQEAEDKGQPEPDALPGDLSKLLDQMAEASADDTSAAVTRCHQALMTVSPHYKQVMNDVLHAINVLPPSAAMASFALLIAWTTSSSSTR